MSKRKNQKRNVGKGSRHSDRPSQARWKTSGEGLLADTRGNPEAHEHEVSEPNPAAASDAPSGYPSVAVQVIVSAAVVAHFLMFVLSYTAIIDPSTTHASILDTATPYLRATHFAADGRPFYLGHGIQDEQPHRLQVASLEPGQSVTDRNVEWTTIQPQGIPGLAESDRYARWMVLAETLAKSDRASLAATAIGPFLRGDDSIDAVRVVRLPTLLTTVEDDKSPVAYLARVVNSEDEVRLVAVQPRRMTTFERSDAP